MDQRVRGASFVKMFGYFDGLRRRSSRWRLAPVTNRPRNDIGHKPKFYIALKGLKGIGLCRHEGAPCPSD
jgi:hypothetical protein